MGRIKEVLSKCKIWRWYILIFVTVGSQKFQFNRLLIEIDRLIESNLIDDKVFAQIGYSTYIPKNFDYKMFLDKNEYIDKIDNCEIVITHGGTGSIINSVKKGKKVIGVPRQSEYGEHVDNHQYDIIDQFYESNLIYGISGIESLEKALREIKKINFREYTSNTKNIIGILDDFLLA